MANPTPVIFSMPGYNPPGDSFITSDDGSENMGTPSASGYRIPPAVWMVAFLVISYLGIRWVME